MECTVVQQKEEIQLVVTSIWKVILALCGGFVLGFIVTIVVYYCKIKCYEDGKCRCFVCSCWGSLGVTESKANIMGSSSSLTLDSGVVRSAWDDDERSRSSSAKAVSVTSVGTVVPLNHDEDWSANEYELGYSDEQMENITDEAQTLEKSKYDIEKFQKSLALGKLRTHLAIKEKLANRKKRRIEALQRNVFGTESKTKAKRHKSEGLDAHYGSTSEERTSLVNPAIAKGRTWTGQRRRLSAVIPPRSDDTYLTTDVTRYRQKQGALPPLKFRSRRGTIA